ncbi:hypothetical protein ACRAWG_06315 [Methylobacterium sp. P31]
MRRFVLPIMMAGILCSGPAFAGSDQTQNQPPQSNQQSSVNSAGQQQSLLTAQKLKQDLQNAGFTDVSVLNEAFVVRAKSKNGDPVVMTIGPSGFNMVEAVRPGGPSTTGSTGSSTNTTGNSGSTNTTSH